MDSIRTLRTHLLFVITVGVVLWLLRVVVVDAYRVPSESMLPTLRPGDWLAVERFRYAPTLPGVAYRLPRLAEARVNDVVVFSADQVLLSVSQQGRSFVKRVVAVAGDTVLMRDRRLIRNGALVPAIDVAPSSEHWDTSTGTLWWLQMRASGGTRFGAPPSAASTGDWGPIVVPRDSLFVLGDNRGHSVDSRHFGFVPLDAVHGVARVVYFSVRPATATQSWEVDHGRIGHIVR
jgi:signal peptidase I